MLVLLAPFPLSFPCVSCADDLCSAMPLCPWPSQYHGLLSGSLTLYDPFPHDVDEQHQDTPFMVNRRWAGHSSQHHLHLLLWSWICTSTKWHTASLSATVSRWTRWCMSTQFFGVGRNEGHHLFKMWDELVRFQEGGDYWLAFHCKSMKEIWGVGGREVRIWRAATSWVVLVSGSVATAMTSSWLIVIALADCSCSLAGNQLWLQSSYDYGYW